MAGALQLQRLCGPPQLSFGQSIDEIERVTAGQILTPAVLNKRSNLRHARKAVVAAQWDFQNLSKQGRTMHKRLVRGLMASSFGDAQTSIDENVLVTAGGGGGVDGTGIGGGGGGGDNSYGSEGDGKSKRNVEEALAVLKEASRSLESLPSDLAQAIERGAIPGYLVEKFLDLEGTPVIGLFTRFSGFRERLLADDLFLTKVLIECGVGMFTKVSK